MAPVLNRIALDCAALNLEHCYVNEEGSYQRPCDSELNDRLTLDPNIDQTNRDFVQELVMSMFDEGCVAVVPVDTDVDPTRENSIDIYSLRVGKITNWYPRDVEVYLYNDQTGDREYLTLPKHSVAIIPNPFYAVMNEPNSTLKRLIATLNRLDSVDEENSGGKLDLIIQLPYAVKSDVKRIQANERVNDIQNQLRNSEYGIAYIDGTEHVTQLNRPAENQLASRVEYLTNLFYSQLGITQSIFDNTADEQTLTNYYTRVIEPVMEAIVLEFRRKFLTKTARTRGQSILYFRDPFKLVPVEKLPDLADKFTRNEIMTSNEFRSIVGLRPSDDPSADELRNKNLNQSSDAEAGVPTGVDEMQYEEDELTQLSEFDNQLDELEQSLEHGDNDILAHYASPYYDPQKAHEYYEKHKQLKGKTSTSGLNEEGRKAASYVKSQLNAEKKAMSDYMTDEYKSNLQALTDEKNHRINSYDEEMKKYNQNMQTELDSMREIIRQINAGVGGKRKGDIKAKIKRLRAENAKKRVEISSNKKSINEQYKTAKNTISANHREDKQYMNEFYKNSINSEMENIKSEGSFQAETKAKGKLRL